MARSWEPRGRVLRILVALVCGSAFSLFGYDQALYGGVSSGAAFLKQFNHPSPELTGHTAAVYDLGCLAGAWSTFFICQRFGHRKTLVSMIPVYKKYYSAGDQCTNE